MKLKLPESPVLKRFTTEVAASDYNAIRLAQIRAQWPLDIILGGRGLRAILGKESWLIIDRNLNEAPLLAWTAFRIADRTALHRPVTCDLVYYHAYATVVVRTLPAEIRERLPSIAPQNSPAPVFAHPSLG